MTREMGVRFALLSAAYLGVVAWSAATLFYQIALGRQVLWIGVALGIIAAMVAAMWFLGRRAEREPAGRRLGLAEGSAT